MDQYKHSNQGIGAGRGPIAARVALRHEEALRRIAEHFDGCDLSEDRDSRRILSWACGALGWGVEEDEHGQVKLNKGAKEVRPPQ